MSKKQNEIFTPELIKILKIFGFVSIGLVFILSFFNSKRANNSGEDLTFRMSSSSRMYFLNVRTLKYDRETRSDAGMILFRHGKRAISGSDPQLDLVIILNNPKDEAYLYLEPVNLDWPLEIKATQEGREQIFHFDMGNNFEVLEYVRQLEPWIESEASFVIKVDSTWIDIWSSPKEKDALKTIIEDYFRLINEKE